MALEQFANNPLTTVLSGGTDAPAAGTSQTWTVSDGSDFPTASSTANPPTQFHIADPALVGEIIAVTNVAGNNWTVTRGAEGTAPAAHASGFSVTTPVTAGTLGSFVQTSQMTTAIAAETSRAEAAEANMIQIGGDIGGTVTDPEVTSIQGTEIAVPSGNSAQYLDATGHWSSPASTGGFTNPMTTAGDTLYGTTSGAATRLPGNTATTRKFLTETGTGTAANAPAWNTLQVSDLPAATTGAAGIVQLTGDLGGTATSPEVLKIQGTSVAAPTGSSTQFLNALGQWAVPAGGGGGGAVPGMNVIWMDALGADATGGTSVTTLFNSQLTAQAGKPCLFVFGVGTYLWSAAPNALGKNQSVMGLGSRVTNFTWSGSGSLFNATEAVTGAWNGSDNAGSLSGFSINGPFGTGGTAGIAYSALQGLRIDDVGFYGLDGGAITGTAVGTSDWAEEAVMTRLDISGCGATSGSVFSFTGTSFDYSSIDAVVVVEANIDVLALHNGAELQGLQLNLRGNLHGGTSNTGALISIDRGGATNTSLIGGGVFGVSMEADGTGNAGGSGTVGPWLLWMENTSSASQFSAAGSFTVFNAGATCQGINNPNNLPVSFLGPMNSGTQDMLDGEAGVVYGGLPLTTAAMAWDTLYENTLYPEFADVMAFQLASGAQTLAVDANSAYVRRFSFLVKQPSSGAAGTVTWPASFHWMNGSAPTLQTANSAIDQIDAIWDPVTATYYARPGNGSSGGSFGGGTLAEYLAPAAATLTYATTITVNAALANAFNLTLTGNTTLSNPTNPGDGQVIRFRITQGSGGSHTVSWGTAYDFATGSAPTLSTTAGKVDIVAFEYVASISKWACLNSGGLGY